MSTKEKKTVAETTDTSATVQEMINKEVGTSAAEKEILNQAGTSVADPIESPEVPNQQVEADVQPDAGVEIIVLAAFRDKADRSILYTVGQSVKFDTERAADVVKRGLAKYVNGRA